MHLRTALAASVSVAALLSTTFAATAQTDLTALYEAAKAEGQLTTIALPHTWCGYGEVIEAFKAKYPGITVNELNPDAGSADELEAIRANKGNTGPQAPDVIDVGLSFGPAAKEEGLLQAYKVSTWDSIPADAKDADGFWYGDYYGVLAFGINKDVVTGDNPQTWADLLKPEYANQVALAGDNVLVDAEGEHAVIVAIPEAFGILGVIGDVVPGGDLVGLEQAFILGLRAEGEADIEHVGGLRAGIADIGADGFELVGRAGIGIEFVDGDVGILGLEALDHAAIVAPGVGQGDDGELAFGLGGFIERVEVGLGEGGGRNGKHGKHRNGCAEDSLDGHVQSP